MVTGGVLARDVEVDSDTVYDRYIMLHLQLYFQDHTSREEIFPSLSGRPRPLVL